MSLSFTAMLPPLPAPGLRTVTVTEGAKVKFRASDVTVPVPWSDAAASTLFRIWARRLPGCTGVQERWDDKTQSLVSVPGYEHSVYEMVNRVVNTIGAEGIRGGYFDAVNGAVFCDELRSMFLNQYGLLNTPAWVNIGATAKPQASACFIVGVGDSLASLRKWQDSETVIFNSGSGSGADLSAIRPEGWPIAGGGMASGPVSFARGTDSWAGTIKSGGRARRAAKMITLHVTHPDIRSFITAKRDQQRKAHALIDAGFPGNWQSDTWQHLPFQNSNLSVRVTDEFMQAVINDTTYQLVWDGAVVEEPRAREIWDLICECAWETGDPGLQYDTTINKWHTVPKAGRIVSSNPCQPAFATVLTPDGIRTFADIDIGSTIWSGKQWTKVTRKVYTGVKPVYTYATAAGTFVGTENHRVISRGKRVEAQQAETIDHAVGVAETRPSLDEQAIMDGWVLGDGTVHKASNNLVLLDIGAKDHDIFTALHAMIRCARPGIGPYCHEVFTTITAAELPHTYMRRVPQWYLRAPATKLCAFLRGLYSANGSICDNRVTLKATSLGLVRDVQAMLSSLGIVSYITVNKAKKVQFNNGEYLCKESYDLNITKGRKAFAQLIGFVQADKTARLGAACKTKTASKPAKSTWAVSSVIPLGDHPVYDITVEADEHTYWTGGLLVSNCSEFLHHNDTACNLASLNLLMFRKPNGSFDTELFLHCVRLCIVAQEIICNFAGYPTPEIAENSRRFRPLGLGYCNLGALLMCSGMGYDSDEAREYAAAITALMGGQAYRVSAELAKVVGPFEGFAENREEMLAVARMHRDASMTLSGMTEPYEDAEDKQGSVEDIGIEAAGVWGLALQDGKKYGFRNSQATLLAPTGTIGMVMDADTTGVEPEYDLVTYKTLAGGGIARRVSGSVREALAKLGREESAITKAVQAIESTGRIGGVLDIDAHDRAVLATAAGEWPLEPAAHVRMMAAVQPFLSGGISKTVNMPATATVEEVSEVYKLAWESGVKCVALYRDGCKRSQPLNGGAQPAPAVPAPTPQPQRRSLPDDRAAASAHKLSLGGHDLYMHVGYFDDGMPGELFVRMAKVGTTESCLLDALCQSVSVGLQYGVPLEKYLDKWIGTQFEPAGFTGADDIRSASSPLDLIAKKLRKLEDLRCGGSLSAQLALRVGLPVPSVAEVKREVAKQVEQYRAAHSLSPCCGATYKTTGSCKTCSACGATSGGCG